MTHDNFATDNKIGLPLTAPSTQTILPIISAGNGMVEGFLTIAKTTFAGTETTFMTSNGPIAITTVTLPRKVDDGSGYGVNQYMAAVYDDVESAKRPWLGYSAFVNTNDTGYLNKHYMPTQGQITRHYRGILVTNLLVNMAEESMTPDVPVPPVATPGTIRWVASMQLNSAQMECGFFDFNWVDLFKAKASAASVPMRLDVVNNPAGGQFKSTLVGNPIILPEGGTMFNTVRIIKLHDAPAGDYVFTYTVTDTNGLSTTCTLTLTLV